MVTGKGGVGKSTIAASYAISEARKGKRTLLVEIGDHSYYQYVFKSQISFTPTEVEPRFSIAIWSGETCLREYVLYLLKIKKLVNLFFDNRVMRTFIKAAPALKELAVLGKITSGIRQWGPALNYDLIVVDGLSTGHFLALLKAPVGMSELIQSGPMGEHSRKMQEVLKNPNCCKYVIVALPEELPISETVELKNDLLKIFNVEASVICNKVYKPEIKMTDIPSAEGDSKKSFTNFLNHYLKRQNEQLEVLQHGVGQFETWPLILSSDATEVIEALTSEHI